LPGADKGAISTSISEKATVSTKRPVRKQPSGLKMRFRPIGFGSGEVGRIGSSTSSADESSTRSDSDEEMTELPDKFKRPASISDSSDDNSDDEMIDAPIIRKHAAKSPKSKDMPSASPLKRKHGEETEVKNSSSRSEIIINDRELKIPKKKETNSRKPMAGSQSASIETSKTPTKKQHNNSAAFSHPIIPPATGKTHDSKYAVILPAFSPAAASTVKVTPIPPPKRIISLAEASQSSSLRPSSQVTVGGMDESLEEEREAIDPNLTAEERRIEIKKLKRASKARRREST
jgi:hypothetical protein